MALEQRDIKGQLDAVWDEYCGFLNLSINEYMNIQKRLLTEQISLYHECELGKRIMGTVKPMSTEEFRKSVPLSSYDDYADILLQHVESALPEKPAAWLEVPWKGNSKPHKAVPFTQSMLESCSKMFASSLILSSSGSEGSFAFNPHDRLLCLAPPAYFSGLLPYVLGGDLPLRYSSPVDNILKMTRLDRIEAGVRMGVLKDSGFVIGASAILSGMSDIFWDIRRTEGIFSGFKNFNLNYRFLKAVKTRRQIGAEIKPRDVWHLKGLVCMGAGTEHQKKRIENTWGIRPTELFGTPESGWIGTETWDRDGLVLLPDICFYEFIPSDEFEKNLSDPKYTPKTYLENELIAGESYELVITSFKGGAFLRCRLGEVLKCISLSNGYGFPRFSYVDKTPDIIDLAGLTAFTERTVLEAIRLSKLDIEDWFAVKEYDRKKNPFMHLYVEIGPQTVLGGAVTTDIMHEHLNIYFGYLDGDYPYVKRLTGTDPLKITILPTGTIKTHQTITGRKLRHLNPTRHEVVDILRSAYGESKEAL